MSKINDWKAVSKKNKFRSFGRTYIREIFYLDRYKNGDGVLLTARMMSTIIAFLCMIVDTLIFSNFRPDFTFLKFLSGLTFILYEIAVMVYASATACYGAGVETWIYLLLSIVNCFLAHYVWNNENHLRKNASIVWVFKVLFVAMCAELAHYNFRKLRDYDKAVKQSSRYMLRQTILFTLTMLFLVAPGLKTVYQSIYLSSANCSYEASGGFVEIYAPKFEPGDPCESGLIAYISAREELRILRDFIYFHIAFYAICNQPFLDVSIKQSCAAVLRSLMLAGFLFLMLAYLWANINPFSFAAFAKIYLFDTAEIVLVVLLFSMLIINILKPNFLSKDPGPMTQKPSLLYRLL